MRAPLAASAMAAAAAFTCPPPTGHALAAPFLGSWSAGVGSTRYYAQPDTLSITLGVDSGPDVEYCIADAFVSPVNANRAFITIGNPHNHPASSVDVACALLDVSGLPDSVQFGIELNVNKCPTATGLNFTGWRAGPTKLACPAGATIPATLLGNGSMVPAGYKANSFVETSKAAWTFVNEGALVSTWCAADVAPVAAPDIMQIKFANSASNSAGPASGGEFGGEPWSPGTGCVWIAKLNSTTLAFKWGTVSCPSNFSDAVSIPYSFHA